jgi:hypothetical protein
VGHPVEPLADVRSADARSAQIGSCPLIGHSFQVSEYSGEPIPASLARNLLAKHDWRLAGSDEFGKDGPQVPFIFSPSAFPRNAEWLAWQACTPDWSVFRPSGKCEGKGPS